jgi:uncharacterized protein with HEPN domain
MKRDDLLFFLHIRDSINRILEYSSGKDTDEFFKNSMVQDAVVRQLEIIGEASSKVRKETREKYSNVPWKQIIVMRNRIIHEYFGVRPGIVWDTVQNDIPILKNDVQRIIEDLTPQSTLDF